jgi:heme/copper-type cytochrome/quinol oxidase subunit 3
MEIPYVVTPRKDTGLFNSKVAIWLFLASEVMLFGGFFSAYVFLRIGADYPWPERTLPVLPGLINTIVLIGSSVTVVFAWASLKMRQWRNFQIYMGITVACAAIFMVLKGVEYNVKLHHQAVRLKDYTVIEGHLAYEMKEGAGEKEYAYDHNNKKVERNNIAVAANAVSFNVVRFHGPWVDEIIDQAAQQGGKLVLAEDVRILEPGFVQTPGGAQPEPLFKAGEPLSKQLMKRIQEEHLASRRHNSSLRTNALRSEWAQAKKENPGLKGWELAGDVSIDMAALEPKLRSEVGTVVFNVVNGPVRLHFPPRQLRQGAEQSRLRDDTQLIGAALDSPLVMEHIDAIDFQHLAMRAVEREIDPIAAIESSWLIQNDAFARGAWEWHKLKVAELEKELLDGYGTLADGVTPKREPTAKERYRIGWKELAKKAEEEGGQELSSMAALSEEFMGPNYAARGQAAFPELSIPRERIGFASKFNPAWNTYYAIYFTITGLHGLHVIGGAIVLAYYLFFGRKMYLSNPEWLANRVEVGGLFWHFVDLVWIFVFPILYLM